MSTRSDSLRPEAVTLCGNDGVRLRPVFGAGRHVTSWRCPTCRWVWPRPVPTPFSLASRQDPPETR